MMNNQQWSRDLLKMLQNLNNYHFSKSSSKQESILFIVNNKKAGILTPAVAKDLKRYQDVFEFCKGDDIFSQQYVKLQDNFKSFDERTKVLDKVIKDMKRRDAHISLHGWRNENYNVAACPIDKPLLKIERAAVTVFGVKTYGSHMNGYVNHPEKGLCLWIARRSKSKQTFPGMYDNMVAGGIESGRGISETLIKECQEEAGIPKSLAEKAIPTGMISYVYEDERGIQPDVQYCFDLEVPHDFQPIAVDGEVDEFFLCTIEEVKKLIVDDNFKPNCAAVTLDFLIRKGFVIPDNVPDYIEIIQLLHYRF